MENTKEKLLSPDVRQEKTLGETLLVPFEPLLLHRPLKLFKKRLGLEPGVRATPDPEFLVFLATGFDSHQAMYRSSMEQSQFKTFENMVRGKHKASQNKRDELAQILGIDSDGMQALMHGKKDGPLLPQILELFRVFQGIPIRFFSLLTAVAITCPHCQANIMEDSQAWWGKQELRIGQPEYQFVERLLNAAMGGYLIVQLLKFNSDAITPIPISVIANPKRHPMGNWLEEIRVARGRKTLSHLANDKSLQENYSDESRQVRMRKWASGQDMMPNDVAKKIIGDLPNEADLHARLLVTRTLALATDFIRSAAISEGYPRREIAQKLVRERLKIIEQKVWLALSVSGRKVVLKNCTPSALS